MSCLRGARVTGRMFSIKLYRDFSLAFHAVADICCILYFCFGSDFCCKIFIRIENEFEPLDL